MNWGLVSVHMQDMPRVRIDGIDCSSLRCLFTGGYWDCGV